MKEKLKIPRTQHILYSPRILLIMQAAERWILVLLHWRNMLMTGLVIL